MATHASDPDRVRRRCGDCAARTVHEVTVEIRTESDEAENAQFSREPYRVLTCRQCGSESATRMNNA